MEDIRSGTISTTVALTLMDFVGELVERVSEVDYRRMLLEMKTALDRAQETGDDAEQTVELDHCLRPFVLDYVVGRPDLLPALRNRCRQAGIQIGTIDALLAQLCIARELTMLTADADFQRIAGQSPLRVWSQPTR